MHSKCFLGLNLPGTLEAEYLNAKKINTTKQLKNYMATNHIKITQYRLFLREKKPNYFKILKFISGRNFC